MANLAQIINVLQAVILTNKEKMILTPTYHVLEMYNVHQDATLLGLKIATNDYVFNGQKLPAVSASASKDSTGVIHISLVNIDPNKTQTVSLNLNVEKVNSVTGRVLASKKVQDYNSFDEPEKIKPADFKGFILNKKSLSVTLLPASVVVLTIK